jgi:hypothetical protein
MTNSSRERAGRASVRLVACGLLATCTLTPVLAFGEVSPADSAPATFAAHESHEGLVIDHASNGHPGLFAPEGWFRWPGEPILVMRDADGRDAGLWLVETGKVVVRAGTTKDARVIGRVEPSWDDDAIRLSLEPAGSQPLRSGVFRRIDLGAGPSMLDRNTDDSLQLLGTYQATLRDRDGRDVGWMRVEITNRGPAVVSYSAARPAGIDERLTAAAAEALGSEVDYIQGHARGTWKAPEHR